MLLDKEALADVDALIKVARKNAGEKSNYYAALFYLLFGAPEKAREYVDKTLAMAQKTSSPRNAMVSALYCNA